jgi:hypothetical protein
LLDVDLKNVTLESTYAEGAKREEVTKDVKKAFEERYI